MDLADTNNEVMVVIDEDVMAVDDEEVLYISNIWFDVNADSSAVR
jgi:hypothetical protein